MVHASAAAALVAGQRDRGTFLSSLRISLTESFHSPRQGRDWASLFLPLQLQAMLQASLFDSEVVID